MKFSHNTILNESDFSKVFCAANIDFKEKWNAIFLTKKFELDIEFIDECFIPDNKYLDTKERRLKFYLSFIKLISECQITFEQALMLTKKLSKNEQFGRGVDKFQKEELVHSLAYRHFLSHCEILSWPKNSLLLGRKAWIRKILYFWIKHFPEAMYLVGAKSEIFSLCFSKLLTRHHSEDDWTKLNRFHLEDEVHHIPFAIQLHNELHNQRPLYTIFVTYVMFIIVQFINLSGTYNLVKEARGDLNFLQRIQMTISIAKWIVRDFKAYQHARKILKDNLKKFNTSNVYQLMAR